MTPFTLNYASLPNVGQKDLVQQPSWPARPAVPCRQLQKQEAERAFEAGVQWFLAVSRSA